MSPRMAAPHSCPYCAAPYVSHVTGCVNRCSGPGERVCGCVAKYTGEHPADCPKCGGTGRLRVPMTAADLRLSSAVHGMAVAAFRKALEEP